MNFVRIAIEKSKLDAVEGVDTEQFPIEFNDVDLCLRIAARGWSTMFTTDSVLIHRRSATRDKALLLQCAIRLNGRISIDVGTERA